MLLSLALVACKHDPALVEPLSATSATTTAATTTTGGELSPELAASLAENFARVHFATDSSTLDDPARLALAKNAAILLEHREVRVEVQGHADGRGTTDYNLALGERRGEAVVRALVAEGVAPSRLLLVSYGEERPLDPGTGEVAWAENRRAEFRLLTAESGLRGTTD